MRIDRIRHRLLLFAMASLTLLAVPTAAHADASLSVRGAYADANRAGVWDADGEWSTAGGVQYGPGSTIPYKVTWTNDGDVPLTNLELASVWLWPDAWELPNADDVKLTGDLADEGCIVFEDVDTTFQVRCTFTGSLQPGQTVTALMPLTVTGDYAGDDVLMSMTLSTDDQHIYRYWREFTNISGRWADPRAWCEHIPHYAWDDTLGHAYVYDNEIMRSRTEVEDEGSITVPLGCAPLAVTNDADMEPFASVSVVDGFGPSRWDDDAEAMIWDGDHTGTLAIDPVTFDLTWTPDEPGEFPQDAYLIRMEDQFGIVEHRRVLFAVTGTATVTSTITQLTAVPSPITGPFNLQWRVDVKNDAASPDRIPSGYVFYGVNGSKIQSVTSSFVGDGPCYVSTGSAQYGTCSLLDLAPGQTRSYTVTVRVTPAPTPTEVSLYLNPELWPIDNTGSADVEKAVIVPALQTSTQTTTTCPSGQTGTPPNCTTPIITQPQPQPKPKAPAVPKPSQIKLVGKAPKLAGIVKAGGFSIKLPVKAKGVKVAGQLTVTATQAKALGLKVKKGQKVVVIGSATVTSKKAGSLTLKVKLSKAAKSAIAKASKKTSKVKQVKGSLKLTLSSGKATAQPVTKPFTFKK